MMRLGRRATLLVAFSLLTSAAPAYAECAWVLWSTYLKSEAQLDRVVTRKTEHAIERAFDSQRACEQAIPESVQSQLKVWRGVYENVRVSPVDPTAVVADRLSSRSPQSPAENDSLIVRASCWPLGLQPKSVTGGAEYPKNDSR